MKFIETLRLRSKLFLLFVLVTFGLISIGVMGVINASDTKKNIDTLYFGSFIPVVELNEILQKYHSNIAGALYKAQTQELSPDNISMQIKDSLEHIEKLWQSYASHYKRAEELPYTQYAALEIERTNSYFKKILLEHHKGELSYDALSPNALDKKISHIELIIQKLLRYETDLAKYRRAEFLSEYNSLVFKSNAILGAVILIVLLILLSVFHGISKDQSYLVEATKKLKLLNKKLENASYTDSLTGLFNRRYFNLVFEREIKRAKREQSTIAFMMLDIDFFKQYNDTYGHLKGDKALKKVASILQNILRRPNDFLFRLGGEEFGVLLTQTTQKESEMLAQKICEDIKEAKIQHSGSAVSEFLTLSLGVAIFVADESLDGDTMMSMADKMLYEVKESGRDGYKVIAQL